MCVHHIYELYITNLTSELYDESSTNALTIPYPGLSDTDENLNSKLNFCLSRRAKVETQLGEVTHHEFLRNINLNTSANFGT